MTDGKIRLTREGYEKLKAELEYLTGKKRREIAKDLEVARAFGDLKENAEYDAAKNAQALNEARAAELEEKLTRSEILDESQMDKDKILLGAKVTLKDLKFGDEIIYTIVAGEEADYDLGKISASSPIGKALIGHKVGDEVLIQVPAGTLNYEVLKIER